MQSQVQMKNEFFGRIISKAQRLNKNISLTQGPSIEASFSIVSCPECLMMRLDEGWIVDMENKFTNLECSTSNCGN